MAKNLLCHHFPTSEVILMNRWWHTWNSFGILSAPDICDIILITSPKGSLLSSPYSREDMKALQAWQCSRGPTARERHDGNSKPGLPDSAALYDSAVLSPLVALVTDFQIRRQFGMRIQGPCHMRGLVKGSEKRSQGLWRNRISRGFSWRVEAVQ